MDTKTIKSIPEIPFFKSALAILRALKTPIPIMLENARRYGPFHGSSLRPGGFTLFITDPDFMGQILQKNHRNYQKTKQMKTGIGRWIGRGLLTSDGDYWLRQRRLLQPEFRAGKLDALIKTMKVEVDGYGDVIEKYVKSGEAFDIAHSMGQLTFDIVSKALFGTDMRRNEFDRIEQFGVEFQRYAKQRALHPYLIPWMYISGFHRKCMRLKKDTNAILQRIINDRRASGERHDDLLDMLLQARYKDTGEGLTDEQLRDESMILFIAGHETAANGLSWALYLLAQHPEIVAKLRDELGRVVGEEEMGLQHLKELGYMRQVLQESMRLYPPIWIADRVALEEDFVNEFRIPKGTVVILNIYGLHRNPEHWPEPDQFNPDRFTKENFSQQAKFSYCPFGGGPRLCIGQHFAMMEMQLVLAKLIRTYDWELVQGQKIELEGLITLRAKHGIKMKVKRL